MEMIDYENSDGGKKQALRRDLLRMRCELSVFPDLPCPMSWENLQQSLIVHASFPMQCGSLNENDLIFLPASI